MPGEKSASKGPVTSKKTGQGKIDANKSVSNDSISGKKRKKKRESDGEKPLTAKASTVSQTSKKDSRPLTKEESCTLKSREKRKQDGCRSFIAVKKSVGNPKGLDHGVCRNTRQEEKHCRCSSSNSSLENSRPHHKIGRFDEYSSTDAMSTDRLAAMELSSCSNSTPSQASSPFRSKSSLSSAKSAGSLTSSPQLSTALSRASKPHTQTSNRNTDPLKSIEITTASTTSSDTSNTVSGKITSHCRTGLTGSQSADGGSVTGMKKESMGIDAQESLRWELECSDEEKEEERIKVYKEKRRKRYLNVLEEQKSKLSSGRTRQFYVCPSNSV